MTNEQREILLERVKRYRKEDKFTVKEIYRKLKDEYSFIPNTWSDVNVYSIIKKIKRSGELKLVQSPKRRASTMITLPVAEEKSGKAMLVIGEPQFIEDLMKKWMAA